MRVKVRLHPDSTQEKIIKLEPGFYVEHFVKDLGIALAECRRMGIALPGMSQSS